MNSRTAFIPYSYDSFRSTIPNKNGLYQGLDLLLKVVNNSSCGHQTAVAKIPYMSDMHLISMLKPLPSIYKAQFPDLMRGCRDTGLNQIEKASKEYTVAINSGNNTKSSQGSQKLILNENKANAYKRRNVYKSIIRHMFSYIQKNKSKVAAMLLTKGFINTEISTAFDYISSLNVLDKQKGKAKRPQNTIKTILETRNIHVYILKETLDAMLSALKTELAGRVMRKNTKIYKEVCEEYYNRCLELLS
jgi:hypothetical protein